MSFDVVWRLEHDDIWITTWIVARHLQVILQSVHMDCVNEVTKAVN